VGPAIYCSETVHQYYAWTQVLGEDPRYTTTYWKKFCDATLADVVSGSMALVCGY